MQSPPAGHQPNTGHQPPLPPRSLSRYSQGRIQDFLKGEGGGRVIEKAGRRNCQAPQKVSLMRGVILPGTALFLHGNTSLIFVRAPAQGKRGHFGAQGGSSAPNPLYLRLNAVLLCDVSLGCTQCETLT